MADKTIKEPENVPGPYYVDQTCNLCRNCMEEAPNLMKYNDDETYAYFFKQPETPDETAAAQRARWRFVRRSRLATTANDSPFC